MKSLKAFFKQASQHRDSIIIFFVCIFVYLSNQRTISSGDAIPNTLLAFNFLFNHTLHFDAFRNSYLFQIANAYFFVETPNGHLSSVYPIGSAILTFPIYLVFSLWLWLLKLQGHGLEITSAAFDVHRLAFEKLAATIVAAISVVVFYSAARLLFKRSIALISTFIYAFASSTWTISSQGLWQHGPTNVAVLVIIFCLLKSNRSDLGLRRTLLFVAGIFCGLLPGIRPTNLVFSLAAIVYSVYVYRKESVFLFIGLPSALLSAIWNLYYFNNLVGFYEKMSGSFYALNFRQFIDSFLGILVSPSRGLLIFFPLSLCALPGTYSVLKLRHRKNEQLLLCMLSASIILFSSYCFNKLWWGGDTYGPRYMTDIVPIICFLIGYFLVERKTLHENHKKLFKRSLFIFCCLTAFSVFTQAVGVFASTGWNGIPLIVHANPHELETKFWSWKDNQIERHAKSLIFGSIRHSIFSPRYIQRLQGTILEVMNENGQPLTTPFSTEPGSEIVLRAKLKNTGKARWYGYETGIIEGETRVAVQFWNQNGQLVSESRLYVAGTPGKNSTTEALGSIQFPKEAGIYKLSLSLMVEGVASIPDSFNKPPYQLEVRMGVSKLLPLIKHVFSQDIQVPFYPKVAKPNFQINLPVFVKNTSNFSWDPGNINPVNLSYHWIDANGQTKVFNGERTSLPFKVSPEGAVALNALVKTPEQPGKYTLQLTMVQELVTWFEAKGAKPLNIPITITDQEAR